MGIEHSQEDRLLAHAMPGDDPTWGEVSAFMEAVDSAYAEVPTTPYEAAHLAAVFGAARSIRNGIPIRRNTMKDRFTNSSHRVLIASVAAALLALTAGVGAASALGGGPLANLLPASPGEVSTSPQAAPSSTPVPTATESDDESDDQDEDEATPTATPTKTPDHEASEKASAPAKSHESEESDDKAEKSHDDGDDDEAEDADDQGEDQEDAGDSHHGDHEDGDDDGGHEDDSED